MSEDGKSFRQRVCESYGPRDSESETAAELARLREESLWIRKKLNLPADTPFVSGAGPTLAGSMHVVCDHAHGYMTYITAYRCNDKQGEIARLTVACKQKEDAIRAALEAYRDRDLSPGESAAKMSDILEAAIA